MELQRSARQAFYGRLARERMQRIGYTPRGDPLWTAREDKIFRELFPDYKALRRKLRRRTKGALRSRAYYLKLSQKQKSWTAAEVTRLRKMWRDSPRAEILAAFPGSSWLRLERKGRTFGIRRRPWKPKLTGNALLDAIRQRAADLRISMADLDRICAGRRYFKNSSRRPGCPRRNLLFKAIKALGGRIEIVWD